MYGEEVVEVIDDGGYGGGNQEVIVEDNGGYGGNEVVVVEDNNGYGGGDNFVEDVVDEFLWERTTP